MKELAKKQVKQAKATNKGWDPKRLHCSSNYEPEVNLALAWSSAT